MINWISSNTKKITDFNVGSTARTLLESVAIEMEELYYQLLVAVQEAIEEAIYRAFNFQRNPAEVSTGIVRFQRLLGTDQTIFVPRATIVSTSITPPTLFQTQSDDSIPAVNGRATGGDTTRLVDYTKNWVNEGIGVGAKVKNITDGGESPPSGVLAIQTTVNPNDTLLFGDLTGGADFSVNTDWFASVWYDDGSTPVDITAAASGIGTLFPLALVLNQDHIYLGSLGGFYGLTFSKGAGITQDVMASLIIEYWNGANWVTLGSVVDATSGVTGKPFSTDGAITWNLPSDWVKTVYQNLNYFWVRISSSATLTSGSQGDFVQYLRGDAYTVVAMFQDIDVQAVDPGVAGNVAANTITVLNSNIPNVASVTNLAAFANGKEEETALARKARFALYIQSLARATRGALEYAARTVPQIVAAKAIDDVRPTVLRERYGVVSIFTDITVAMRNPSDPAVALFENTNNENDALYIGGSELFDYVNVHLIQDGVIVSNNLIWEYYSTTGWKTLSDGLVDDTDDSSGPLTKSGTLSFNIPDDWVVTTIKNYRRLWIRLRRIGAGETYYPIPTGDWCSLPPGFGDVYLYCHDGSGELNSSLIIAVQNAVELYRGCGITVDVKAPTKVQPTITIALLVAPNYDADNVASTVWQALIDYLNAKVLGEDLYLAELYRFIMDSNNKAILNVTITEPANDLIISSSAVIRPDPNEVTVTGVLLS